VSGAASPSPGHLIAPPADEFPALKGWSDFAAGLPAKQRLWREAQASSHLQRGQQLTSLSWRHVLEGSAQGRHRCDVLTPGRRIALEAWFEVMQVSGKAPRSSL